MNINGNNVDPQGIIYLQTAESVISMKVLLLSGASLDIDTRMKNVEFRDISQNEKAAKLMISAIGAEPTRGQKILRYPDGSWKTEISLRRPLIYLLGEGDIPMRQEFILNGKVREIDFKIENTSELPLSTYSSEISTSLKKLPQVKIEGDGGDSVISDESESELRWDLKNLDVDTRNRRTLRVTQGATSYLAAWDVTRYRRWDLNLASGIPLTARIFGRFWFENQHLGLGFEYQKFLANWNAAITTSAQMRLPVYWSIPAHYNMKDLAWGPYLQYNQSTFEGQNVTSLDVGGFYQATLAKMPTWLGQWSRTELTFVSSPMSSEPKTKSHLALRSELLYRFGDRNFYSWGLEHQSFTVETGPASTSLSKTALIGGLHFQF